MILAQRAFAAGMGCLLCTTAYSNDVAYLEPWRWTQYGLESGLPGTRVFQLFEAVDGVVWVKCDHGIAWYDGFTWHALPSPPHVNLSQQTCITRHPDGGLLLTNEGRVFVVQRSGFARVDIRSERTLWISSAVVGRDGAILLSDEEGRLYRYDGHATVALASPDGVEGPATWNARPLRSTRAGDVLLQTHRGLYERVDHDWAKLVPLQVATIERSSSGVWLARVADQELRTLWMWDADSAPGPVPDEPGDLRAADMAPNGDAVAIYQSGVVRVRQDGQWRWLDEVPSALGTARTVRFQSNGDLWSSSDGGLHLCVRSTRRWDHWDDVGLKVNAIMNSREGDIWIGNSDGLVIRRADGTVDQIHAIGDTALGIITGIAQDATGAVWISSGATFTGVFRFENGAWRRFGAADGLPSARFHRVSLDRRGRPWFLGHPAVTPPTPEYPDPGAFVFTGDQFEPWGPAQGLVHGRVYAFAESSTGARWFATHLGISRWAEGTWTHWTIQQGLRCPRVFTLAVAPDGRLWFGHYANGGGLGRIDVDGSVSYLTSSDGLIDDRVWEVQFGPRGRLWIATTGGLASYQDGAFSSFGQNSGLPDAYLWPVLPESDRVLVGTLAQGVFVLHRDEEDHPAAVVRIKPATTQEDNAVVGWETFPYRGEQRAAEVDTRYRFDDGKWSAWSTTHEATAFSIAVGAHRIEVQSKSLFGHIGPVTAARFRMPVPWYLHPLFMATVAAWFLALVGMVAHHSRRRRQQMELLRASEERYRNVVEDQTEFIVRWRPGGECTFANAAYCNYFGLSDATGTSILDSIVESDRDALHAKIAGLSSDHPAVTGERRVYAFDGSIGYQQWTDRAIWNARGEVIEYQSVGRDITHLKLEAERRQSLEAQLRESQKMEAVGQLAAGMSHEFNNFLTALMGYTDMAADRAASGETVIQELEGIRTTTEQALGVTRSLLTFCRKSALVTEPVRVVDVIRSAMQFLDSFLPNHIHLVLDAHDVDEAFVAADATLLRQVMVNLALNARDAMPVDGTLRIVLERVPEPAGGHGSILVHVADQGVGIPEDIRDRIFEPFFTTKTRERGTGLGLAIVHGIVSEHGGSIAVESKEGQGTTVTVTLPCCAPVNPVTVLE